MKQIFSRLDRIEQSLALVDQEKTENDVTQSGFWTSSPKRLQFVIGGTGLVMGIGIGMMVMKFF